MSVLFSVLAWIAGTIASISSSIAVVAGILWLIGAVIINSTQFLNMGLVSGILWWSFVTFIISFIIMLVLAFLAAKEM